MRDIESLKQRIEAAEKHNSSAELARDRESEALLDMWHQIRTRFTDQEGEIARYRTRLEEMTQKNSELGRMVDELLATVEGNLGRTRDETVPRITNLAEELLSSEPSPFAAVEQSDAGDASVETETEESSFDEAPLPVSDNDDDAEPEDDGVQIGNSVPDPEIVRSVLDLIAADDNDAAPSDDDDIDIEAPANEAGPSADLSLSDGIRDIISKVEGMSSSVPAPTAPAAEASAPDETVATDDRDSEPDAFLSELLGALKSSDEDGEDAGNSQDAARRDDALDQELREIESLRNELTGLRDRLSTGSAAN